MLKFQGVEFESETQRQHFLDSIDYYILIEEHKYIPMNN